ncbi:AEC family transporter [Jeotgalibacillus sp. S-D1]|uniref:AEC family transporter n=1 Tax=Jeotgalibacillus sp. S-D1 TaxID=2552189 RepID=UPI001059F68D|nr:AEC family transporter [Jeotgalibacillus sp. S-D1]TDL34262.1 AEC family transporter [Jeotgalibacillus sp. S-D1]
MEIIFIFVNILVPIFILVGIGAWMHKLFKLDLYTLAKLNIYFLSPGFFLVSLYQSNFSPDFLWAVFSFFALFVVGLYILVQIVATIGKYSKGVRGVFTNSVLLFNSGNYGIPVNDLVFRQDPVAMTVQVMVMTFQSVLAYSFGIFSLKSIDTGRLKALAGLAKMPVIYAMIAGLLLNAANVQLPTFILKPGEYIANAMIGLALLTLGAQVAQLTFKPKLLIVYISLFMRLLIGPVLGYAVISLLGYDGVLAQALLIASSVPSSVNSAIIAQEYRNEPELAAQIVMASTIFSMFTVTLTIYFSHLLFA